MLTRADLEAIADVARERDIMVLADEIYGRIVYEGEHVSIASLPGMAERTIVLDGFSKTYAMTGWRLGYAIVPPTLVDAVQQADHQQRQLHQQLRADRRRRGAQRAAGRRSTRWSAEFRARRELVVDGLNRHPRRPLPRSRTARSTSFPNVAGTGMTGSEFDRAAAPRRQASACCPGTAFGQTGPDHIRISYANSQANLRRALERIEEVVAKTPAATPA